LIEQRIFPIEKALGSKILIARLGLARRQRRRKQIVEEAKLRDGKWL